MIKIRLSRLGKRNNPFYRIVAIEEGKKRDGKPADILGFWDKSNKKTEINRKKLEEWKKKGAIITKAVENLL